RSRARRRRSPRTALALGVAALTALAGATTAQAREASMNPSPVRTATPVDPADPKVQNRLDQMANDPVRQTPWAGDDLVWFTFRSCIATAVESDLTTASPVKRVWVLHPKQGQVRVAYTQRLAMYCDLV